MDDLIIAPLDCDALEHALLFDPDVAFGDLALLSEAQLTTQAVAYTSWLSASDSCGYEWQPTLRWWNDELAQRARAAAATSGFGIQRPGTVYLLHLERPLSPNHTAQHYIGQTYAPVVRRLKEHRAGTGARFTQVACERGIAFLLARTWSGDRRFERRLKNRKCGPRLCPICNPPVRRPLDDDTSDIPF